MFENHKNHTIPHHYILPYYHTSPAHMPCHTTPAHMPCHTGPHGPSPRPKKKCWALGPGPGPRFIFGPGTGPKWVSSCPSSYIFSYHPTFFGYHPIHHPTYLAIILVFGLSSWLSCHHPGHLAIILAIILADYAIILPCRMIGPLSS